MSVGDLPGPLCLASASPFVWRASELAVLRALMPWAERARKLPWS